MSLKKLSSLLACMMLAASILISAVYAEDGEPIAPQSVTIGGSAEVTVGSPITLVATVLPTNAADKSVTWASTDTSIATVDVNGKVSGIVAGQTTITATTINGITASKPIKVNPQAPPNVPASSVTVQAQGSTSIQAGATTQLIATVAPNNATDKTVSWSSSDNNVATVESNGLVTGKNGGTATITATSNGIAGTIKITVAPKATATSSVAAKVDPTGVTLQGPDIVEVGKMIPLLAVLTPEGANKTVTWMSSDTAVASVSHGQVTGISPGTAVITVYTAKDNVKATKTITVVPAGSLGTDSAVSDVSSEVVSSGFPAVSAVGQGDIYSGIEVVPPSSRANILGLVAWICIILGIVIVLLVLFSSKRPNAGLPGKKRYHRRPAKGHKKRLLDDRYYRSYRKK